VQKDGSYMHIHMYACGYLSVVCDERYSMWIKKKTRCCQSSLTDQQTCFCLQGFMVERHAVSVRQICYVYHRKPYTTHVSLQSSRCKEIATSV